MQLVDQLKQHSPTLLLLLTLIIAIFVFKKFIGSVASDEEIRHYLREGALIIDVRSRGEVLSTGLFPGAIHIPIGELEASSSPHKSLPRDQESAKIIVYCASGMRSASAQGLLKEMGYRNVVNAGGLSNMMRFK
ncbi:hypothetical protein FDP41_008616 [Naegleria fowleri]|uniref:Rhodanese domain-containing protein n=1 Tax=Naegleria fowleri TaxID=5763 RepID=A0A6A5BE51_NAEFO|nr:uncharacterized protein FDP41_008616 [Naegleria fowleri]KAF0973112.1 hypothetical protein FDP41_008616 [Naegleria fowleri]CAG4711745.1 unnamed protein product [Naegleria fowleri]